MSSIAYPLGAPSVKDGGITVDLMVNEPTRITRYLADMSMEGFFIDKIFSTSGISGGALLYDQLLVNDLYTTNDVGVVSPGGEFPMVEQPNRQPKVATPQKIGGKFAITDEARKRNNPLLLQQGVQRLANTIRRKMHEQGIKALNDALTELGGDALTMVSTGWTTPTTTKAGDKVAAKEPTQDFIKAGLLAEQTDLGVEFDTWLVNPAQKAALMTYYGANYQQALSAWGVSIESSKLIPEGEALVVASGQVGAMALESPLTTETWDERRIQSTWIQSFVTPAFAVTNPMSIVKVTGLNG